jgi:hypothetical protein
MLPLGLKVIKCEIKEVLEYNTEECYIVFQELDTQEYYIATRFKNWNWGLPKKGDTGYIEVETVKGGISEYYSKEFNCMALWLNDYIVFNKFIPETTKSYSEIIM